MLLLSIFVVYTLSALVLPFPNWTSFRIACLAVATTSDVSVRQRASMLSHLAREVLLLPVWAIFWLADEIFFASYHDQEIREPIFIISQPRSGTTFLLRTMSEDQDTFLSVKHLEWRYPYISFWKLIDVLWGFAFGLKIEATGRTLNSDASAVRSILMFWETTKNLVSS